MDSQLRWECEATKKARAASGYGIASEFRDFDTDEKFVDPIP